MANREGVPPVDCSDLADFQRVLNKLRSNETNVNLKLNCALPTNSFHKDAAQICDRFQKELAELRRQRYNILYDCLRHNQQYVNLNRDKAENAAEAKAGLQNAMSNLRFIRNEQAVEEIITAETDKTVRERCRKAMIR